MKEMKTKTKRIKDGTNVAVPNVTNFSSIDTSVCTTVLQHVRTHASLSFKCHHNTSEAYHDNVSDGK